MGFRHRSAWRTRCRRTGIDQVADGDLVVVPLPITTVPNMTVVAKIRVSGGELVAEVVFTGGCIEATGSPKRNLGLLGRWLDWENRTTVPSWISVAWLERDDRLLKDAHSEPYDGGELEWPSWRAFAAAQADPQLPMAGVTSDLRAIGHSIATAAAVLQQDGAIPVDRPDSPSCVTA